LFVSKPIVVAILLKRNYWCKLCAGWSVGSHPHPSTPRGGRGGEKAGEAWEEIERSKHCVQVIT